MKVCLIGNTAWSMIRFRSGLMQGLLAAGHEVVVIAPSDEYATRIEELGITFVGVSIDKRGTHPLRDLRLLFTFIRLIRQTRPDLIISYTIKPVIFAAIVARWHNVPSVSVITGLGTVFLRENWLTRVVEGLYRWSQSAVLTMFFLNDDDLRIFRERRLGPVTRMQRLPSEGVNISHFSPGEDSHITSTKEALPSPQPIRFVLIARLLWEKGIGEYVKAARKVRQRFPQSQFALLGILDVQNPDAVSLSQIEEWVQEGVVNFLGATDDVRQAIAASECVVLPSYYREGIPRTLLEAAAMCCPIITTDVPGCRDVVDDGINGYLCRPKDPHDLAQKMVQLIEATPDERRRMGAHGRLKVQREFDERVVVERYRQLIAEIMNRGRPVTT